jgi:DNA-binding response OmpR family regulator
MAILIVEDEQGIVAFVRRGLEAAGYTVVEAADGIDGLAVAMLPDVELVILDLGLPGIPGEEVLRRLRAQRPAVPVIILTAKDAVSDRVANLEAGADDYLTKPFSFSELLARVRARLRTAGQARSDVIAAGNLVLDLGSRTVSIEERTLNLSAREFALLEVLVRNPKRVLSREQLLDQVWGYDFDGSSNVVEVYVGQIRRKIGGNRIETVRGVGYRLLPI